MHDIDDIFARLGLDRAALTDGDLEVRTPITGELLAPAAPRRRRHRRGNRARGRRPSRPGATCRRRAAASWCACSARSCAREKDALGALVTLETGKIAPGGPRRSAGDDRHLRLRGRPVAPAVRPDHRLRAPRPPHDREVAPARAGRRDHGLQLPGRGVGWNAALALVCGDPVDLEAVARSTPLTALACQALIAAAPRRSSATSPTACSQVVDRRRRLARAAGRRPAHAAGLAPPARRAMGTRVAPRVARRLGRSLLELGGNNAMIVAPTRRPRPGRARDRVLAPSAPPASAARRCAACSCTRASTTSCVDAPRARPTRSVPDRRSARGRHAGAARSSRRDAVRAACRTRSSSARADGGEVAAAASACWPTRIPTRYYVRPALVRHADADRRRARRRRSRRILYVHDVSTSSTRRSRCTTPCRRASRRRIFTTDLREAERFLAAAGSRLRHRQRQHRPERRRDRRRLRRREGDRRRPRVRLRRLEGLHAPRRPTRSTTRAAPAGPGHPLRHRLSRAERGRSGSDP